MSEDCVLPGLAPGRRKLTVAPCTDDLASYMVKAPRTRARASVPRHSPAAPQS